MTIHYDPRAIEAKRQRADELAKRRLTQPAKGLHTTDFAAIVILAAVLASSIAGFVSGYVMGA